MPTFQAVISVTRQTKFKKAIIRDFPGSPVVKSPPCSAGGVGSIPGLETKIPHAMWFGQKKEKIPGYHTRTAVASEKGFWHN